MCSQLKLERGQRVRHVVAKADGQTSGRVTEYLTFCLLWYFGGLFNKVLNKKQQMSENFEEEKEPLS